MSRIPRKLGQRLGAATQAIGRIRAYVTHPSVCVAHRAANGELRQVVGPDDPVLAIIALETELFELTEKYSRPRKEAK